MTVHESRSGTHSSLWQMYRALALRVTQIADGDWNREINVANSRRAIDYAVDSQTSETT
jgi:hypothetical protein